MDKKIISIDTLCQCIYEYGTDLDFWKWDDLKFTRCDVCYTYLTYQDDINTDIENMLKNIGYEFNNDYDDISYEFTNNFVYRDTMCDIHKKGGCIL